MLRRRVYREAATLQHLWQLYVIPEIALADWRGAKEEI